MGDRARISTTYTTADIYDLIVKDLQDNEGYKDVDIFKHEYIKGNFAQDYRIEICFTIEGSIEEHWISEWRKKE